MTIVSKEISVKMDKKSEGPGVASIMYSVFKKASLVGIIYLAGYMRWSVAWFVTPVILLVIRDQWRKKSERRRNIAKAAALASEKDVILARLDDLPAWVFFPDIERAEWLNRIIKQVWPNVNHYARDLIRDVIQPNLRKSFEKYKMNGFKFERIILGSVPPRIGGVKVYDKNVSRNEIIMDLDIFYAGDCDINFFLSGVKGGIKDFQLHGMVRVVMKPLITTMPLVGGLQVFFLNNPEIDFNLVGIADLLDMPGLSDMLRKIVTEQVAAMMVLPNKFPIKLSDGIEAEELKIPQPEGVLRVHVIEAKHLMKKDIGMLGKGKSDPYAVITVGAQEFKTKTINNSVDPKWDYWCEAKVTSGEAQLLTISLWDWDAGLPGTQNDDFLGRATIEVANIVKKGEDDLWVTLEQAKHGMLHLRLTWLVLSSDYADLKAALEETQLLRVTTMSTALITVYIDSAKNLPQARSSSKPDPYVVANVGKDTKQTVVQMRTSDPVWEQGFSFLVANPESDTLYLNVFDHKTSNEIGQFTCNISNLSQKPNLEIKRQPFALVKAGPESKILLSMNLRILKREVSEQMQGDMPDESQLQRQSSTISQKSTSSVTSTQVPPSPIKKQSEASINLPVNPHVDNTNEVIEEIIEDSSVSLQSAAPPNANSDGTLLHRTPSVTSSAGELGLGRIQLTLKYSVPRQKLVVVVHKVANLPLKDPSNIPDPYVKLYLLPERHRDTKRKTVVVKDNCSPVYDESFEYLISQGELYNKQLEVTVGTQKQLFYSSSNVMGQVVIDLGKINLNQPYNAWFDLQPESDA